jgi:hypothetical protein
MQYVSPWLTHFVGHKHPAENEACYDILTKILRGKKLGQWHAQGSVRFSPGTIKISAGSLCKDEFITDFYPVCFCDIPEQSLERHTKFYGCFGVAFTKAFLMPKGANPVFYVAKGSVADRERPPVPPWTEEDTKSNAREAFIRLFTALSAKDKPVHRCEFFDRLASDLASLLAPPRTTGEPDYESDDLHKHRLDIYFNLARHVFAFMKFFDESLLEEDPDNFYMEREWRVAGFVEFELHDIQRVYVAPGFRRRVESEFSELKGRVTELKGRSYRSFFQKLLGWIRLPKSKHTGGTNENRQRFSSLRSCSLIHRNFVWCPATSQTTAKTRCC